MTRLVHSYPAASRGPSIFLDKTYVARSKGLCSQGSSFHWLLKIGLYLMFLDIDEFIVTVTALDPRSGVLFGLDSKMNFHRSADHGVSWKIISSKHFYDVKSGKSLIMSTGIPENMVSVRPGSFWSATTSSGRRRLGHPVFYVLISTQLFDLIGIRGQHAHMLIRYKKILYCSLARRHHPNQGKAFIRCFFRPSVRPSVRRFVRSFYLLTY